MIAQNPIPDVPEFGRIDPNKKLEQENQFKPDAKSFQSLMNEKPETTTVDQPSPMQLASSQPSAVSPSFDSLLNLTTNTQTQADNIKNQLNTPNLALKNSHQRLLDTKLSEANIHLQKASQLIGAKEITTTEVAETSGPIAKFLGYITDGQNRLIEVKKQIKDISKTTKEINPGEMMLIQINLSQAQQEIEFSSILLSKVTDALKQTFSIQL